jgi:hypothetical protein
MTHNQLQLQEQEGQKEELLLQGHTGQAHVHAIAVS